MCKKIALLLLWLPAWSSAQTIPYEAEVQKFEAADRQTPPPARPILFIGSSSFTYWREVQAAFPDKQPILNRAFGGSTLTDLLRHYPRIVPKYQPRQVVMYCGENDIATANATADEVYERFVRLFTQIRRDLPGVPFVYVAMKPSPARWALRETYQDGNARIRAYLRKQRKAQFVDVWPVMLDPRTRRPVPALFTADSLHMNEQGYARWTKLLRPTLR
jgi:lysophospholipase L1-like esterase